ncbi:MAG: sugar porter family MFS transporter [Verrucomicrobiota bacterium]
MSRNASNRTGSDKPLNSAFVGAVAALSGVLFGFDCSIAASVGSAVNAHFDLLKSPFLQGLWVGAVPLGALIGALLGGFVSNKFGRRAGLLFNALLFIVGIVVSFLSPVFAVFVFSRLLMGLAIGNSAVITPMYMAEVAPPESRGRILFLYQLSIVIGILVSFLVGVGVDAVVKDNDLSWRVMIASGLVPAILFFLGMLRMPRSPRWLVEVGRESEARHILRRMVGAKKAGDTMREIEEATARKTTVNLSAIFGKTILPVIALGFFLQFFQQSTGINADMYFGPEIFRQGGFDESASMWAQVAMGTINLIATVGSIFMVDRLGRRKLMFVGVSGIVVMLLVQAFLFQRYEEEVASGARVIQVASQEKKLNPTLPKPGVHAVPAVKVNTTSASVDSVGSTPNAVATPTNSSNTTTYLIFGSILLYIIFFAISAGPLCWLMISEVFPIRFRGIGMSIAVAANWMVDYLVSQLFPTMKDGLGMPVTCLIYAGFTLVGLALAVKFLPETKGVPLEEIEENIYAGKPLREIGQPKA